MNVKNFTVNFKSLLIRLAIGMVASVIVTGIAYGLLHAGFWNYWWTLITGGIIGAILMWNRFQAQRVVFWIGTVLIALPAAATQYALFFTEDEPEQIASMAEYDPQKDHRRYVDIHKWYYNTENMGVVEITTEYKRRGRTTGTSKRVYVALPMYEDSLSTDPKVWMALDFSAVAFDALESEDELIRFDDILCFERLAPSLADDFRSAIDYCEADSLKSLRDEAVFLAPLYSPFMTRREWMVWSTCTLLGAILGMALLSLFVRRPQDEADAPEVTADAGGTGPAAAPLSGGE